MIGNGNIARIILRRSIAHDMKNIAHDDERKYCKVTLMNSRKDSVRATCSHQTIIIIYNTIYNKGLILTSFISDVCWSFFFFFLSFFLSLLLLLLLLLLLFWEPLLVLPCCRWLFPEESTRPPALLPSSESESESIWSSAKRDAVVGTRITVDEAMAEQTCVDKRDC